MHPVHQIEQSSWTGLDRAEAWRTSQHQQEKVPAAEALPLRRCRSRRVKATLYLRLNFRYAMTLSLRWPSDSVQMAETLPVLHEHLHHKIMPRAG